MVDGKKPITEMIAEALRELGVLVLVFAGIDRQIIGESVPSGAKRRTRPRRAQGAMCPRAMPRA